MHLVVWLIVRILTNIIAFLTAAYFLDRFTVSKDIQDLFLLGLLFALVNFTLKPIVKLVLGPLIFLTLGFFLIVVHAAMLFVTDKFSPALTIGGIDTLIWATLIISAVNFVVHLFVKK